MMTTNVLHRVFQIKYGDATGTCFTIDIEGKQYLVTAKHVIEGIGEKGTISIYRERWIDLEVRVVGLGADKIDVAVLSAPFQLSPQFKLEATSHRLALGGDVYFLGFPYGLRCEAQHLNRGFPVALVRKGVVSSLDFIGDGGSAYLLDGHNNPGFSGGPMIFEPPGRMPPKQIGDIIRYKFRVGGIISAYRVTYEPVLRGNQPTPFAYESNTGLVVCYGIHYAKDLVAANPIGLQLPPKSFEEMEEEEIASAVAEETKRQNDSGKF